MVRSLTSCPGVPTHEDHGFLIRHATHRAPPLCTNRIKLKRNARLQISSKPAAPVSGYASRKMTIRNMLRSRGPRISARPRGPGRPCGGRRKVNDEAPGPLSKRMQRATSRSFLPFMHARYCRRCTGTMSGDHDLSTHYALAKLLSMSESPSWRALSRDRLAQAGYRVAFDTCACSLISVAISS